MKSSETKTEMITLLFFFILTIISVKVFLRLFYVFKYIFKKLILNKANK